MSGILHKFFPQLKTGISYSSWPSTLSPTERISAKFSASCIVLPSISTSLAYPLELSADT